MISSFYSQHRYSFIREHLPHPGLSSRAKGQVDFFLIHPGWIQRKGKHANNFWGRTAADSVPGDLSMTSLFCRSCFSDCIDPESLGAKRRLWHLLQHKTIKLYFLQITRREKKKVKLRWSVWGSRNISRNNCSFPLTAGGFVVASSLISHGRCLQSRINGSSPPARC